MLSNWTSLKKMLFGKELIQCSQWNFTLGVSYPLLLKNGGIKKKIGVQNKTSMDTKLLKSL